MSSQGKISTSEFFIVSEVPSKGEGKTGARSDIHVVSEIIQLIIKPSRSIISSGKAQAYFYAISPGEYVLIIKSVIAKDELNRIDLYGVSNAINGVHTVVALFFCFLVLTIRTQRKKHKEEEDIFIPSFQNDTVFVITAKI